MKSEFISVASHELRTPLTSIKNAVDIILKKKAGEITDTQEKFLFMAERNISRLSEILNDLLDLAKIESGKTGLNYDQLHIRKCIEQVISTLKPIADKKSISLKMTSAPHLPMAYAAPSRIEQVLVNLVGNAIKFTPEEGSISIAVNLVEKLPEEMSQDIDSFVEVSVTDTGIGLSEESLKHLFEKFYQAETSLSRKAHVGTGLGLSISKGIIEAHGGEIHCKSKEGIGSTFSFTLPIHKGEKMLMVSFKKELSTARQAHEPFSILLIKIRGFERFMEDYGKKEGEQFLELIKELLIKKGC